MSYPKEPREFTNLSDNADNNGFYFDERRLEGYWGGEDDEQPDEDIDDDWLENTEQNF